MEKPPEGDEPQAPQPPEAPEVDLRRVERNVRALAMFDRQTRVIERLNRGWSFREVAADLNLSVGQVLAASRAAIRAAQANFVARADEYRARLLAKNHTAQAELWRAYERARDRGKVSQTSIGRPRKDEKERAESPVVIKQSTAPEAEARLLTAILKAQHEEACILGIIGGKDAADDDSQQPKNVTNNILVMNAAGLSGAVPWFETVPAGFARQGVGLLPVGAPDPGENVGRAAEVPTVPKGEA